MLNGYYAKILDRQPDTGTVKRTRFSIKYLPMISSMIHLSAVDDHIHADLVLSKHNEGVQIDVVKHEEEVMLVINGMIINSDVFRRNVEQLDFKHTRPQSREADGFCFVTNDNMITIAAARQV